MADRIGARQSDSFKAVCTAPSSNKTPVGPATPPLPYPTVQDLSNSVSSTPTVKFNRNPAYVLDQTTQPSCKGDEAGSATGVKSGTVNGEVKPVIGSSTVFACKKKVVRQGDACTMNGGNNPGIYVTTQVPSCGIQDGVPTANTNPLIKAQTPEEQGWLDKWWQKTKREVAAALDQPWEGLKGAAKGIGNIPSDIGEMLMKGSVLQSAGDMDQAAAWQGLFGDEKSAQAMSAAAQEMRAGANDISLPKFEMSNAAQAGGDKIATAASLLAGGAGLAKGGVKGLGALGKAGVAAGETAEAGKVVSAGAKAVEAEKGLAGTAKSADAVADAGKTVDAAEGAGAQAKPHGDGVKITKGLSNHEKAALGEKQAHAKMQEKGYEPIGKTDGKYEPGKTGIDGVYKNPSPPPDYIVTEVKYGSAQLEKGLADGTNQMDNKWIQDRLPSKVGRAEAANIADSMRDGRVEKWLIRVSEDGSAVATKIDASGVPIRGLAGRVNGL